MNIFQEKGMGEERKGEERYSSTFPGPSNIDFLSRTVNKEHLKDLNLKLGVD